MHNNVWQSLEAIAQVHLLLKDYELALEYIEKAISYYDTHCNVRQIENDQMVVKRLRFKRKVIFATKTENTK